MKIIFYISFLILISSFNSMNAEELSFGNSIISISVVESSEIFDIDEDVVVFIRIEINSKTINNYNPLDFIYIPLISKDRHIPPESTSI